MMTEREKLIELLDIIIQPGEKTLGDIADYLLANGVIVPPCRVGDTLYVIEERWNGKRILWERRMAEICVRSICYNGEGFDMDDYCGFTYFSKDFGKTVFLSREDAEKALEERKDK